MLYGLRRPPLSLTRVIDTHLPETSSWWRTHTCPRSTVKRPSQWAGTRYPMICNAQLKQISSSTSHMDTIFYVCGPYLKIHRLVEVQNEDLMELGMGYLATRNGLLAANSSSAVPHRNYRWAVNRRYICIFGCLNYEKTFLLPHELILGCGYILRLPCIEDFMLAFRVTDY
jgi:hypothetical protein